jgi:hypothetical protein
MTDSTIGVRKFVHLLQQSLNSKDGTARIINNTLSIPKCFFKEHVAQDEHKTGFSDLPTTV